MATTNQMAEISALLGDPARAAMLGALMDGRALTAGELATAAGITAPTASAHLARLTGAGLLAAEKQGRHRYHRLASPEVARMIEGIMQVATALRPVATGPRDAAMRAARTCYDHLAGRLGVALADALVEGGQVELAHDGGLVTEKGVALLRGLGIEPGTGKRPVCRPCLDWSERRPHIAGSLGAALCAHCFAQGWVRRVEGSRAVTVTPHGSHMLRATFGLRAA